MTPNSLSEPVQYRAATKADLPFILSSWVRSYTHKRRPPEGLTLKAFRAGLRLVIADILRESTTRLVVACNPHNERLIWGWACYDDGPKAVLYYAYVKEVFRGCGIGTELTRIARNRAPGVMQIAFRTPACRRFLPEATFNPRLLRKNPQEKNAA